MGRGGPAVEVKVWDKLWLMGQGNQMGWRYILPHFLSIILVYPSKLLLSILYVCFFAHLIYLISWLCSRIFTQIPFTCHKWNACLFDLFKWLPPPLPQKRTDKHTCALGTRYICMRSTCQFNFANFISHYKPANHSIAFFPLAINNAHAPLQLCAQLGVEANFYQISRCPRFTQTQKLYVGRWPAAGS